MKEAHFLCFVHEGLPYKVQRRDNASRNPRPCFNCCRNAQISVCTSSAGRLAADGEGGTGAKH